MAAGGGGAGNNALAPAAQALVAGGAVYTDGLALVPMGRRPTHMMPGFQETDQFGAHGQMDPETGLFRHAGNTGPRGASISDFKPHGGYGPVGAERQNEIILAMLINEMRLRPETANLDVKKSWRAVWTMKPIDAFRTRVVTNAVTGSHFPEEVKVYVDGKEQTVGGVRMRLTQREFKMVENTIQSKISQDIFWQHPTGSTGKYLARVLAAHEDSAAMIIMQSASTQALEHSKLFVDRPGGSLSFAGFFSRYRACCNIVAARKNAHSVFMDLLKHVLREQGVPVDSSVVVLPEGATASMFGAAAESVNADGGEMVAKGAYEVGREFLTSRRKGLQLFNSGTQLGSATSQYDPYTHLHVGGGVAVVGLCDRGVADAVTLVHGDAPPRPAGLVANTLREDAMQELRMDFPFLDACFLTRARGEGDGEAPGAEEADPAPDQVIDFHFYQAVANWLNGQRQRAGDADAPRPNFPVGSTLQKAVDAALSLRGPADTRQPLTDVKTRALFPLCVVLNGEGNEDANRPTFAAPRTLGDIMKVGTMRKYHEVLKGAAARLEADPEQRVDWAGYPADVNAAGVPGYAANVFTIGRDTRLSGLLRELVKRNLPMPFQAAVMRPVQVALAGAALVARQKACICYASKNMHWAGEGGVPGDERFTRTADAYDPFAMTYFQRLAHGVEIPDTGVAHVPNAMWRAHEHRSGFTFDLLTPDNYASYGGWAAALAAGTASALAVLVPFDCRVGVSSATGSVPGDFLPRLLLDSERANVQCEPGAAIAEIRAFYLRGTRAQICATQAAGAGLQELFQTNKERVGRAKMIWNNACKNGYRALVACINGIPKDPRDPDFFTNRDALLDHANVREFRGDRTPAWEEIARSNVGFAPICGKETSIHRNAAGTGASVKPVAVFGDPYHCCRAEDGSFEDAICADRAHLELRRDNYHHRVTGVF